MDTNLKASINKIAGLMREREEELDKRQKELEKMKVMLEEEHPNLGKAEDVLSLNVGGTYVSVLRRTLTQIEGSMMASKFNGRWDESNVKDSEGRFFIDQDIDLFRPLLNYLRALASQTQLTTPPISPTFSDDDLQKDFHRMVDYYGMTPGVFPVEMCTCSQDDKLTVIATHPDFEADSKEKETFWLTPRNGIHKRQIKSFEVTLGPNASVQIGWTDWRYRKEASKPTSRGYQGSGYTDYSIAFDSMRGGMVTNIDLFVPVPGVTIEAGTVIRCESKGDHWSFDGEPKVSTTYPKVPNTVQVDPSDASFPTPCLTVKGSFRITNIELDF